MISKSARISTLSPARLLSHILEDQELVSAIQALAPKALSSLIQHVGLEDSSELISLATTEQLSRIFDDDLWRSARPGQDEDFDADRFSLWLEVMLEAGEGFAAEKLVELDEDLVTMALYQQLVVIDLDELAIRMAERGDEDDGLLEKALESCLCEEFGRYRVVSRDHGGWNTLLCILVALDRSHHPYLERLLERLCYLSEEYVEESGGLYEVLTAEEMLEVDVAADREDRRAREGYVAPSSATAFLALARTTALRQLLESRETDPLTRAYFRSYQPPHQEKRETPPRGSPQRGSARHPAPVVERAESSRGARLMEVLQAAGVWTGVIAPTPLLTGHSEGVPPAEWIFKRGMAELRRTDQRLHELQMSALNYLANTLIAGCRFEGRSFRPAEAAEAAVATCNLGFQRFLSLGSDLGRASSSSFRAAEHLAQEGAVKLFTIGWHILHHEVSLPAADALERSLARRSRVDATELSAVAQALHAAVEAGKPWMVSKRLTPLDPFLGETCRRTAQALLEECPSLAGPGRGQPSDGGSGVNEFIATEEHLRRARSLWESF